ncbi:MAG: succinylglutamate desuccinylase/aspartoacylase family protein [Alphaproteobacteria bacterium]
MASPRFESDRKLEIEGLTLARGERAERRMRVLELADGSWIELPVVALRGAKPGPVFYLGAAFHGDEVNGVELVQRFARTLDLRELRGTIVMVPVQNPLAFQVQHRYFLGHFIKSPLDQSPADPWVSFPGDADGNMAGLLAWALFDKLMQHADYLIDIHTPTTGGRYAPFAFLPPPRIGDAAREAEALATAFGADFILSTEQGIYVHEQTPHVVMAKRGAVAMGIEVGEGGRLEPAVTERGLQGLANVFRTIGMLGGVGRASGRRMVISAMTVIRARRGGILHLKVALNQEVAAGAVVATITNMFGEVVEEIAAPHAGPVVRIATFPVVSAGERVVQLGVPR